MSWIRIPQLIAAAIGAYWLCRLLSSGYRRRRLYWPGASWLRFAGALAAALVLLCLPAIAEIGIDLGYYSRAGMTSNQRGIWILLALAAMFGGAVALLSALSSFAYGDPRAPFTLAAWRRGLTTFFR